MSPNAVAKELKAKGSHGHRAGCSTQTTTKDYGPIAQTVKQSGADALFYAGYDAQGAQLAKALKAVGYKGIRMSGNGVKSSVFTDGAKRRRRRLVLLLRLPGRHRGARGARTSPRPTRRCSTPRRRRTPRRPTTPTNIVIQAIKTAKDAGTVTRQAVNDAVSKTDYKGITADDQVRRQR